MTAAAFEFGPALKYSAPANAAYTSHQYHGMTLSSGNLLLASTDGQKIMGILQDQPASGENGTIIMSGVSKAVFGGTVAALDPVSVNSDGHFIKMTDESQFFVGWALQAAVSGDIKAVFMPGVVPSGDDLLEGKIQYAEVSVTSAEMLALYTTPKTLVAAPGAGYVLEFVSMVGIQNYGTATYATRGDLAVKYTDGSGTAVSDTIAAADLVQLTADGIRQCQVLSADVAMTENAALVLTCATGNPDTGNGTFEFKVAYKVHKTNL